MLMLNNNNNNNQNYHNNHKNKVVMLNNIKWDKWDQMINIFLKILTVKSYNNHQVIKYK